MKKNSLEKLS